MPSISAIEPAANKTQTSADPLLAAPNLIDGTTFGGASIQLNHHVLVVTGFRANWVGALHSTTMIPTLLCSDLHARGFEAGVETLESHR